MFTSPVSIAGFLVGSVLTVGLLTSDHLAPGGWGYGIGYGWSAAQIALVLAGGLGVLLSVLWSAGRLIGCGVDWKHPRCIAATLLIALVANTLFVFLVEFFALKSGMRALVALTGMPVIYGNLLAVLGDKSLKESMLTIFSGALATMGAGFIVSALIKGW